MQNAARGEMIRKARIAKGLTQQELADATGISLRSVQRVEKAEVLPRLFTLKVLGAYLGIDVVMDAPDDIVEQANEDLITIPDHSSIESVIRRSVTTGVSAIIFLLAAAAFLSQSSRFPETDFELFSFWTLVSMLYLSVVRFIWRPKPTGARAY